ncbi:MAG: energy transducer TonB, partial [Chitinophagales bacterium]|nr:energy transducer TonB [Chitinophagales bacterium]
MSEHTLHIEKGGFVNKEKLFAYLRNELNDAEKLRIEKLITQDPFLQDAVEGLKNADLNTIDITLNTIFAKVDAATIGQKTNTFSANIRKYAAAASIILLLGMSWVIIDNLNKKQSDGNQIASEQSTIEADKNSEAFIVDDSSDMGSGSAAGDSISMDELNKESEIKSRSKSTMSESQRSVESTYTFDYTEDAKSEKTITTEMIITPPLVVDEGAILLSNNATDDEVKEVDNIITAGSVTTESVSMEEKKIDTDKDMAVSTKKEKKIKNNASKSEAVTLSDLNGAPATRDTMETVYSFVEQMPVFPGGIDSLNEFIFKNLNTNCDADKDCLSGNVFVKFIVNENGSVSNAQIIKPISPQFDQEVLRVISLMPNWTPGKQSGNKVKVWYTL